MESLMFSSLSEGFRHVLTREAAPAKLTNALALLGNTPEQVTDWCRAFTAYASVGGTIHDLDSLNYQIAVGIHKPEQEPTTRSLAMSDHHDCPGLYRCLDHPKWHVVHDRFFIGSWMVCPPGDEVPTDFPTHAEAINHAQKQA